MWDGADVLHEIRARGGNVSALTMEKDDETGAHYGVVAYTHGPDIDTPLDPIRIGYTPSFQEDYGFGAWGGPYPIIPYTNWRGMQDGGTTAQERRLPCLTPGENCVMVQWPGSYYRAFVSERQRVARQTWFGSQIEQMADATGLMYRRNRYYNPTTRPFYGGRSDRARRRIEYLRVRKR